MSQKNKKINLMISIAGLHHGGAERVVATLCNYLDKDKYSITVCWRVALGKIGQDLIDQGHEVIGLPDLDPDFMPYNRFLVLKKLLREKKIDVIHTHDTGALVDAAQCKLFGSKARIIHTYHYGNYPNIKRSHLIMEMIFSRLANCLVPVGFEQAKDISNKLYISPSRLTTIYNGVEVQSNVPDEDLTRPYRNESDSPIIIGSISTMIEQKGITYLLDTAAILKQRKLNCVFLVVGDGDLREELEQKCKTLELTDMVYFLGWIPHAARKILHSLDIFFQSSLWEANSIVLLEAMAAGLPIVTTKVGESTHVIDDEYNGYVVNPRDTEAMADALANLINNFSLRKQFGNRAKEKFQKNYTIDQMINGYDRLYNNILNK